MYTFPAGIDSVMVHATSKDEKCAVMSIQTIQVTCTCMTELLYLLCDRNADLNLIKKKKLPYFPTEVPYSGIVDDTYMYLCLFILTCGLFRNEIIIKSQKSMWYWSQKILSTVIGEILLNCHLGLKTNFYTEARNFFRSVVRIFVIKNAEFMNQYIFYWKKLMCYLSLVICETKIGLQ